MNEILLFFILISPVILNSQPNFAAIEKIAVKQSFIDYLNNDSSSIVSYLSDKHSYRVSMNFLEAMLKVTQDSTELENIKLNIKKLQKVSDSLKSVLKNKKITVFIKDSLFAYHYKPNKDSDLRTINGWNEKYKHLLEDFETNKMVRFDTIIGVEYLNLIKKQIHFKQNNIHLNLDSLNSLYYEFKLLDTKCIDNNFCINGFKIYRPVFNTTLDKGCYLYSSKYNNKVYSNFIFIEKINGLWKFVEDYPVWLVQRDDE